MKDPIQEIRNKITIEEVVSSYLPLKKAGKNYKGLCPFHNEKTPSFIVSPEKQIAYCFGCHQGGDIFKFTQLMENVEFSDSLKMLAEKASVTLDSYNPEKEKKNKDLKGKLKEALKVSSDMYAKNLHLDDKDSVKVLNYVLGRGVSLDTVKKFKIGFAKDGYTILYDKLVKEMKMDVSAVFDAGLLVSKDIDQNKYRDKFYLRLMFPFFDNKGDVVAFSSRALKGGQMPKYLNSPDTPLFNKSQIMYGFYQAKDTMRKTKEVVVVEGNFDVLASHDAGCTNTIAVSGTALTQDHLKLLKRYAKTIILAFDSDAAGEMATMKSVELANKSGFIVKIVNIPKGSDPADIVKNDHELWPDLVGKAKYYMDHYCEVWGNEFAAGGILFQKDIINKFLYLLSVNPSPIEVDLYIKKIADILLTKPENLFTELKSYKKSDLGFVKEVKKKSLKAKTKFTIEEYLLGLLVSQKELLDKYLPELKKIGLNSEFFVKLDKYKDFPSTDGLLDEEFKYINILMLWIDSKIEHYNTDKVVDEIDKVIHVCRKNDVNKRQKQILLDIRTAKMNDDKKTVSDLLKKLHGITVSK